MTTAVLEIRRMTLKTLIFLHDHFKAYTCLWQTDLQPVLKSGCQPGNTLILTLSFFFSFFFFPALFYSALQKSIFPAVVATFICMPDYHILGDVKDGGGGCAGVCQERLWNPASSLKRSSRVTNLWLQLNFLGNQSVSF